MKIWSSKIAKFSSKIVIFFSFASLGFDLWQVKGGTIFDNIIVTDSLADAKEFADTTWNPLVEAEKAAAAEKMKKEEAEKVFFWNFLDFSMFFGFTKAQPKEGGGTFPPPD